jgi:hypothetical protein
MNIITIGSCMSEGIFAALTKKNPGVAFNYMNHVIHNRSDYFFNAICNNDWISVNPRSYARIMVDQMSSDEFPNLDLYEQSNFYLDNQSFDKIGINRDDSRISFLENIHKNVDLFILDNFMDIAAKLVVERNGIGKYFVFSGAFSQSTFNKNFVYSDFISPAESLINFLGIINWIKSKQPSARIFFAPFPANVVGFEHSASLKRAANLKKLLSLSDLTCPVLSTPDVKFDDMISPSDWCHYSPNYYQKIADQIILF